jgi:hypothetical protein
MVIERSGTSAEIAGLFEKAGDLFVTTLARHVDETEVVVAVPFGIGAGVEERADCFEMTAAGGEVDWLLIFIGGAAELRIALEETLECRRIAGGGGGDHPPNIIRKVLGLCHCLWTASTISRDLM